MSGPSGSSRVPPWVGRIVGRLVAGRRLESFVGDLEEELAERGAGFRGMRRFLWCAGEVKSLAVAELRERLTPRGEGALPKLRRRFREGVSMSTVQDARHGLRLLARSPGFTLVAVLTLALGIGATSAIVSVVNAVLLRPLPYPEPERLVALAERKLPEGEEQPVSPPNFFDWRDETRSFEGLASFWSQRLNLTGIGEPEQVLAATVSYNLFQVLGVESLVGRGFRKEEDAPGAERVAVLSHGFWQRRFGGDPEAVGRTISLNGNPFAVVGVMPAGFGFPTPGTELWVPLRLAPTGEGMGGDAHYRSFRILEVIARLSPEASLESAETELQGLAARLEAAHPESNRLYGASLVPLHERTVGSVRQALLVLLGAVGALLLIACVNVSGLLLARAAGRRKEMALRAALGGSRLRLGSQLLTEGLVLALLGGSLGVLLARLGIAAFVGASPEGIPRLESVSLDGPVLLFTLAASLLSGVVFSLAPARDAYRGDLSSTLRVEGRSVGGKGEGRWRGALVVAQLALAVVLLVGAGLLMRSFVELRSVDPGIRPESVLTVARIELSGRAYRETERWEPFFARLLERVLSLPGVAAAGVSLGLPLGPDADFFVDRTPFTVEGRESPPPGEKPRARLHVVSPGFFPAVGARILRGRPLDVRDRSDAPGVAVINETMAARFWPDEDPIGKRFTHDMNLESEAPATREVVGVLQDVRHFGLDVAVEPQIYVPLAQCPWPQMHLVLRASAAPESLARAVREEVWTLDPAIPVPAIQSLEEVVAASIALPRFRTGLLGFFAAAAVTLAALGLYGAMASTVTRRGYEIGVRLAVGAPRSEILRMFLWEGLGLALVGLTLGLLGSFLLSRLLGALLFRISPSDPFVFTGVALVLMATALLAVSGPARRATRVDPVRALRGE